MKTLTMTEIAAATNGRLLCGEAARPVQAVVRDSREAAPQTLFVALRGARLDGHRFLPEVLARGCRTLLISQPEALEEALAQRRDDVGAEATGAETVSAVLVEDTTRALQDLASWYLRRLGARVIGVTGSTGKTSTKDMTGCVCASRYRTGCTQGNYNNEIGLPLTILGFDEDTEVAVLEMGMDHFGEIARLAEIARPQIGIITNIGVSHLENLGSREGILRAKMEITSGFGADHTLLISTGEDLLRRERVSGPYRLLTTGTEADDDYVISDCAAHGNGLRFTLTHGAERQVFRLPVPGRHNARNAALAAAAGELLGIPLAQAADALAGLQLTAGRLTVHRGARGCVIDDTYNASPDSVRGALEVLAAQAETPRIAILGDMLELGGDTRRWHRQMGEAAAALGIDRVIAVGERAADLAAGAGARACRLETTEECLRQLPQLVPNGAAVLVKGSRAMHMETIVAALRAREESGGEDGAAGNENDAAGRKDGAAGNVNDAAGRKDGGAGKKDSASARMKGKEDGDRCGR